MNSVPAHDPDAVLEIARDASLEDARNQTDSVCRRCSADLELLQCA